MSSLNFQLDQDVPLVADASIIINLNATGAASEIIAALPRPLLVTENACTELEAGSRRGYNDYAQLLRMINAGIISPVSLEGSALALFERLVDGTSGQTLDDGEAATIAYVSTGVAIPVLDERKARRVCAVEFPDIRILSSAELLIDRQVAEHVGQVRQVELIMNALKIGRMRVPTELVEDISVLIGDERAAQCSSLPRRIRARASS